MPDHVVLYQEALLKIGLMSAVLNMAQDWAGAINTLAEYINEPVDAVEDQMVAAMAWFRFNVGELATDIQKMAFDHVLAYYRDREQGES
jgi:hypothetical protein